MGQNKLFSTDTNYGLALPWYGYSQQGGVARSLARSLGGSGQKLMKPSKTFVTGCLFTEMVVSRGSDDSILYDASLLLFFFAILEYHGFFTRSILTEVDR